MAGRTGGSWARSWTVPIDLPRQSKGYEMRKMLVAALAATMTSALGAASAGATIVYEKKDGVYVADDAGKNGRLLVPGGKQPLLTPDRHTLIYKDAGGSLFSRSLLPMPVVGDPATRIAAGTVCPKEDSCIPSFAPNSQALAIVDSKQNLIYARLDGSTPILLAAGVETMATFSPDSQRIVYDHDPDGDSLVTLATVSISGPGATALSPRFAMLPIWTKAGIATTTMTFRGSGVVIRLVFVDDRGRVTKTLATSRIKDASKIKGLGHMQFAFLGLPDGLVSVEAIRGSRGVIRVYSLNGRTRFKQPFKNLDDIQGFSASGKTALVTERKGSLSAVNMKSGKSRTLVKSGVKSAFTY